MSAVVLAGILALAGCSNSESAVTRAAAQPQGAPGTAPVATPPLPTTTTPPTTPPPLPPTTALPPTTVASPTTPSVAPPTTPPVAAPAVKTIAKGSKGPEVQAFEQRLADLRYDVGAVDGKWNGSTTQAVMAFQKVHGLKRDGRATPLVQAQLAAAASPAPLLPDGGPDRVEVDLKRQVLFLYKGGALNRIVAVSTGSGERYCVDGECANAVTPGGSYRVGRRITGWRTSRLGKLYNPLYFNGGVAIHGAPSVPAGPASHGCVRIPMATAEWFPKEVPNGTPVYVVGGRRAAVPFDEPAPAA